MIRVVVAAAALGATVLAGCSAQHRSGSDASPAAPPAAPRTAAPSVEAARTPVPVTVPSAPAPVVVPRPNPCKHNHGRQLIRVSLHQQHMWLCRHRHVVLSSPITSGVVGRYTSTPTGNYAIQGLNRNTVLTLNTGAQYDVKYWIPFDAPLFGFHDSSWQKFPYGSPKYRKHGSHGCVHLPLRTIRFLYHWADIGTPVRIRA